MCVETSSAVNIGYPGRIKCHPSRKIQMDVAPYESKQFQIEKLVASGTHIADL